MKKVLISMMVCILISSCNLFKKTAKEKFEFRQGYELDSTTNLNIKFKDLSQSGAKISSINTSRNLSSKIIKADRIKINADGSLEAEGNAEYTGFDKKENETLDEEENFRNSNIYYSNEAENRMKKKETLKVEKNEITSEVSGKGIIYAVLIVGIVCIVIYLIIKNKLKIFDL